ncbi:DEKNAAC104506 [Brettanomyces naardenensis]|uniref:Large ribosomal subunit protein uL2m n=1 Tax=Brettanomyces naardenensis TaxID=13370 RepID=A0A448YRC9_BRENA|nr:DEKNAAC104506 [Brettanomyces naardenensis]
MFKYVATLRIGVLGIAGLPTVSRATAVNRATMFRFASTSTDASPNSNNSSSSPSIQKRSVDFTELERQDMLTRRQLELSKESVALKKMKPTSPGLRWWRKPIYPYLWKGKPYRPLTTTLVGRSGRNNTGRITVRHRGGGHQRRLRLVDYSRSEPGPQTVVRIEYDPNRTAHIALIKHNNTGNLSYIVACEGLRAGDEVESFRAGIPRRLIIEMGGKIDPAILSVRISRKGNCLPISMVPVGTIIHNIGEHKNGPAKYCRAAGAYGRVVAKIPEKDKAVVQLQSGEQRYVSLEACATLGVSSNAAHHNESLGKAGRSRHRGIRPTVRGVAMNKCDHPLGGGRGKSKSNKLSMSPWGVLAKGGFKTRRGKHANKNKVKDRPRGKEARA